MASNVLLYRKSWFKTIVKAVWIIALLAVVMLPLFVWAVAENPGNLFGPVPSLRDIENPKHDVSSEIISADGVSLGRYYRQNRSMVTYDDLPPVLVKTLIISEDHRFFEHSGVDLEALGRVALGLVTFQRMGGGSTLTQQTAKNLFQTRQKEMLGKIGQALPFLEVVISKTKEWIIAYHLEKNFTKEEIIAMYLNTVPFNYNAYGIKVAAKTYFSKNLSELNLQESAMLVGLLQGTTLFNPIDHPERALRKRNDVLRKLYDHRYLTSREAYDSVAELPVELNISIHNDSKGPAPYFTELIEADLVKWCQEEGIDLYESGLKIHTTIDSRMQLLAEKAMREHMSKLQEMFENDWGDRNAWVDDNGNEIKDFLDRKIRRTSAFKRLSRIYGNNTDSIAIMLNLKKKMKVFSWRGTVDTLFSSMDSLRYYNRFLHTGLLAIEPSTSAVKAWVGGIDHRFFKYDHVKQSARQPGSTFKPFVYGLAIENGYSPCQTFFDNSPAITVNGRIYQVRNSNGTLGDGQQYTMRRALAKSLNTVTMQLMDRLKPENVADFARRLNITSRIDPVYSLGLGTSDVTLYELVAAYSSFVNLGIHTKPYYITRIEDQHGNTIRLFVPESKQVLSPQTAYTMVHMLRGGVEEPDGTSRGISSAVKDENEVGGKTGTTDNGSDGWFVGITPDLVAGVWVGGDERSIHFPRWGESSGGRAALPIWDKFLSSVYKHQELGYKKGKFKMPDEFTVNLDCGRYSAPDSTFLIR